jgi:hypothetical protein
MIPIKLSKKDGSFEQGNYTVNNSRINNLQEDFTKIVVFFDK